MNDLNYTHFLINFKKPPDCMQKVVERYIKHDTPCIKYVKNIVFVDSKYSKGIKVCGIGKH